MVKLYTLGTTLLLMCSGISLSTEGNTLLNVNKAYECCENTHQQTTTNPDGSTTTVTTSSVYCDTPAELAEYLSKK